jgi:hypothetical protein
MSLNVCVASCDVFCLCVVCYFVGYVYPCVLCLAVVPLPPGTTLFALQLNNNNNKLHITAYICLQACTVGTVSLSASWYQCPCPPPQFSVSDYYQELSGNSDLQWRSSSFRKDINLSPNSS